MNQPIRIMLVEDNPDYLRTLSLAVSIEAGFDLVGQYGTAEEALLKFEKMVGREAPDMILLDMNLPGKSGLQALTCFRKRNKAIKIIVLTQSDREADVLAAIAAGANGYLLKGAMRKTIFDGIRSVINGGVTIDPKVANYIIEKFKSKEVFTKGNCLSRRELEILTLLSEGYVQKEISERLKITNNTVSTYIRRIYIKLEVNNAPAAISTGFRRGLLD